MMEESNEIRNLRAMAWERAKGELKSMVHTFWQNEYQFKKFNAVLEKFIEEVEDNALQE